MKGKDTFYDYVVAVDGSGDFPSLQEAINAGGRSILIKTGIYRDSMPVDLDNPVKVIWEAVNLDDLSF